jgi:hypothetical protein
VQLSDQISMLPVAEARPAEPVIIKQSSCMENNRRLRLGACEIPAPLDLIIPAYAQISRLCPPSDGVLVGTRLVCFSVGSRVLMRFRLREPTGLSPIRPFGAFYFEMFFYFFLDTFAQALVWAHVPLAEFHGPSLPATMPRP